MSLVFWFLHIIYPWIFGLVTSFSVLKFYLLSFSTSCGRKEEGLIASPSPTLVSFRPWTFYIFWASRSLTNCRLVLLQDQIHLPLGDSRKYPYHTTDGFHILTPLAFRISKMRYPPMPSDFHNRKPPLPFGFSIFSSDP